MNLYSGKTLDEALKVVKEKYNVSLEEIVYEIVEEKAGFLGIGAKVEIKAYCYKDVMEEIQKYLDSFLRHLNVEHEIEVSYENEGYKVLLNSSNNAVLIGKNGQTLLSLNTIIKAFLQANYRKFMPILIDINGYKDRKYEKIKRMAYRVAKEVQRTKIAAKLDPMPNDERKAIHQYLTNLPYIRTISEGEAHRRYLTIVYDENKK